MKNIFTFLVLILTIGFVSCEDNTKKELEIPVQTNNNLYGNTNFKFPELSENAKAEISHWGAYDDFNTEIKTINGNTIEAVKIKTTQLVSHIDSLTKKVPDTLNTPAIYTRVIVVKTRINLLNQEVSKTHIDSLKLQNYFNEMNIAVKNLIVQINEKFQKDNIDLQRIDNEKQELENQKQFLDSVYKIELQDKKNKKL